MEVVKDRNINNFQRENEYSDEDSSMSESDDDNYLEDEYDYDINSNNIIKKRKLPRVNGNHNISTEKDGAAIFSINNVNSNESTPETLKSVVDDSENGIISNSNSMGKISASASGSLSDYEDDNISSDNGSPILSNLFEKFLNREAIKNLKQRHANINSRLEKLKKVVDPNKLRERGQYLKKEKDKIKELIKLKKSQLDDKMVTTPFLRLMDKCAFVIGLIVLFISEFVLLRSPQQFYLWYTILIVPLMAFRFTSYHKAKYHYFMLDFCYLCQILLLFYLFGHTIILGKRSTPGLFKLVFSLTNGPLAWGTVVWRNSLVFHDVDKLTSVFIHLCPPIVTFCLRWYPNVYSEELACGGVECTLSIMEAYVIPISLYVFWQVFYYVKTEVVDQDKLENDKDIMTSLRWMVFKQPHPIYKLCVKKGINVSPIALLMSVQSVYTLGTLLTVPLLMKSFYLHTAFLLFIFISVSWNGSNYYFEVFTESYSKRLHKESEEAKSSKASNQQHRLKITSIYSFFKFLIIFLISLVIYLKIVTSF